MTEQKRSLPATRKDPDDEPGLTQEFLKDADLYEGSKLKTQGRPKSTSPKEPVKLRLDADVLTALGASGKGWQA